MNPNVRIGKRARVTDLREIWPRETDFSDWLASEGGLALIAEDIGVEVESPKRECRSGDFPCDVVGHALGDENHVVVIENQFGKTNHDHLGKLLTYAAVNGAMTGIWLSEHVSDDHRKVIDWLNDNTPPNVALYLAQIKAYRIDGSAVAPYLDVVSRPNLQTKVERGDSDDELKARHIWRKQMWEEILTYISSQKPPFRVQSAGTDAWSNISIGRSGFNLALTLTPKRQRIGCELYFTVPWKSQAFALLEAQKATIEREIGSTLDWQRLDGKKAARIALEKAVDPKDDARRDEVKQWMHQQAVAFYKAFQPRVKALTPVPARLNEDDNEEAGPSRDADPD
jgi:hypothetical protein